jgi:hypothetical protein
VPLRSWISDYAGCSLSDPAHTPYLLLGDFEAGFRSLCIADFNVGTRTWPLRSSPEDKRRLASCSRISISVSIE